MVNEILSGTECCGVKQFSEDINKYAFFSPQDIACSIKNIFNLPVELKQKIAMKLSAKDYASFRESCLKISQDIDTFAVLNSKVISGHCPREYEISIKNILLNQYVRMSMYHHKDEPINNILGNIRLEKLNLSDGSLFMSTVFSTRKMKKLSGGDINNSYPGWVKKTFTLLKDELSKVVDSSSVKMIQRKNKPYVSWVVGVKFMDEFICYSQLKTIFINLGHAFNQVNGAEKLLIALFADELKSFWCKHIPHGLVKDNIAESGKEIASLFKIATEVRCILQETPWKPEV